MNLLPWMCAVGLLGVVPTARGDELSEARELLRRANAKVDELSKGVANLEKEKADAVAKFKDEAKARAMAEGDLAKLNARVAELEGWGRVMNQAAARHADALTIKGLEGKLAAADATKAAEVAQVQLALTERHRQELAKRLEEAERELKKFRGPPRPGYYPPPPGPMPCGTWHRDEGDYARRFEVRDGRSFAYTLTHHRTGAEVRYWGRADAVDGAADRAALTVTSYEVEYPAGLGAAVAEADAKAMLDLGWTVAVLRAGDDLTLKQADATIGKFVPLVEGRYRQAATTAATPVAARTR